MPSQRSLASGLLAFALCLLALAAWAQAAPTPAKSRLGINLHGVTDWHTELPFIDVFRLSRRWISQREGAGWGKGPVLARDRNGWITKLAPGCWADTPMLTHASGHLPPGDYVVLYQGTGRIEFMGIDRIVEQAPGRIVFRLKADCNGIFLRLRETKPDDYIRNIRVLLPGCEQTYQDEPFRKEFLTRWGTMHAIRFKDWMLTDSPPAQRWEDRPTTDYCNYTEKGVPVEVMVDLCNRLKVHPWFCMPHNATDDYVRRFADTVRATLDPTLTVYLEYSNEVWNTIFPANRYASERAKALNIAPVDRPWEGVGIYYAQRSVEIFRLWEAAFGGHRRLVRVLAWQAVSPWWSERIVLPAQDAYKHADALAIAPYISLRFGPHSTLSADAAAGMSVEEMLDLTERVALPNALKAMADQKRVADKFKLTLIAYAAGADLVGIGPALNNDRLTAVLLAANRHPRMGAIFTQYLDAWKDAGGDLMCLFASTGRWSKYGNCTLAEYYDETEADQPKLKAVLEWNRKHPRE